MKDHIIRSFFKDSVTTKYILDTVFKTNAEVRNVSMNRILSPELKKNFVPDDLVECDKGIAWMEFNNYKTDASYILVRLASLVVSEFTPDVNGLTTNCCLYVFDNYAYSPDNSNFHIHGGFTYCDVQRISDKASFQCIYLKSFIKTLQNEIGEREDDLINLNEMNQILYFFAEPYQYSRIKNLSINLQKFIKIFCTFLKIFAGMKKMYHFKECQSHESSDDQMFLFLQNETDYGKFSEQFSEVDLKKKRCIYEFVRNEIYLSDGTTPHLEKLEVSINSIKEKAAFYAKKLVEAKIDTKKNITEMKEKKFTLEDITQVINFLNQEKLTNQDVQRLLACPNSQPEQDVLADLLQAKEKFGEQEFHEVMNNVKLILNQRPKQVTRKSPR